MTALIGGAPLQISHDHLRGLEKLPEVSILFFCGRAFGRGDDIVGQSMQALVRFVELPVRSL